MGERDVQMPTEEDTHIYTYQEGKRQEEGWKPPRRERHGPSKSCTGTARGDSREDSMLGESRDTEFLFKLPGRDSELGIGRCASQSRESVFPDSICAWNHPLTAEGSLNSSDGSLDKGHT